MFDLAEGDPGARPGPEQGYAACEGAAADVPQRGALGAGAGAAVGKLLGRDRADAAGLATQPASWQMVMSSPRSRWRTRLGT